MLTPAEIEAVTALARQYERDAAPASRRYGSFSVRTAGYRTRRLRDVARLLEMSPDELDGVATFYNLIFRRPVGRHVILICDSVSCWIMGYEALRDAFHTRLGVRLGETTADGRFTLLPIVCLGACDHAPTIMIDDDLHRDVDAARFDSLLEQYP